MSGIQHIFNFSSLRPGRRGRGRGRGRGKTFGRNPRNNLQEQESLLKDFIEPNKIYIGNIRRTVSDEILKMYLCQFAPVVDAYVVRKQGNMQSTSFGFAQLASEEDTQKILDLEAAKRKLHGNGMYFKPARKRFMLPGTTGFQRIPLPDRHYDLEAADREQPCIHILIDDALLRIFEYLPLKSFISIERVCRRWQSLVHACFQKKARKEISKKGLNVWLIMKKVIPSYHSIGKVLLLCGEAMTELSVADVSPNTEGKLLRVIAQLCPALESLTLSSIFRIYNPFLQELVSSCKNLKEFQIKEISSFNEFNLHSVITNLPQLEVLHLEGADIMGRCFDSLPSSLKVLSLPKCNMIQTDYIENIMERCPLLEVLRLEGICIPSALLPKIGRSCCNLRELAIEISVKSYDLEVAAFKNLKKLTCVGFMYSVNEIITSLPRLEELKLGGLILETASDLIDFSRLTQLRTLILPLDNKVTFSPASLKTLSLCTKLEKFKFKGTNEHKLIILELIRRCHFLRELDCPSITLGGVDIEQFVEANKRRQHRLKFVIGLDQSALDQIEKLNDANYDVDMFDVHNLFSDFNLDIFEDFVTDDGYDYYYDSDVSLESDEANFFINNYDEFGLFIDPLDGPFPMGGDMSDNDFDE